MSLQERAEELWSDIHSGPYKKGTKEYKEWVIERFRIALGEDEALIRGLCAMNVRNLCDAHIVFMEKRRDMTDTLADNISLNMAVTSYKLASDHAHDACFMSEEEVKRCAEEGKKHGV